MSSHTIKQWFEAIIDQQMRERALKLIYKPDERYSSFSNALIGGTNWYNDGQEYWSIIYNTAIKGTPFTTLCPGYISPKNDLKRFIELQSEYFSEKVKSFFSHHDKQMIELLASVYIETLENATEHALKQIENGTD